MRTVNLDQEQIIPEDTIVVYVPLRSPVGADQPNMGAAFDHFTENSCRVDDPDREVVHFDFSNVSGGLSAGICAWCAHHFKKLPDPDTGESGYTEDELKKDLHCMVCVRVEYDHIGNWLNSQYVYLLPINLDGENGMTYLARETESCIITPETSVYLETARIIKNVEKNLAFLLTP